MLPPGQIVIAVTLAVGLALEPTAEVTREPTLQEPTTDVQEIAPAEEEAAPAEEEAAPAEEEAAPAEEEAAPAEEEAAPVEEEATPAVEAEPAAEVGPTAEDDEDWDDEEDWDEDVWDDDYDPLRDSPEALEAQRRVVGGAVLVGLGAFASIGALAMGLSDPCARPAGNSCASTARNRAALTMGLPGLAILGAGAAVLAIGLRQRKALRVGAAVSRQSAGVVFSGRF